MRIYSRVYSIEMDVVLENVIIPNVLENPRKFFRNKMLCAGNIQKGPFRLEKFN